MPALTPPTTPRPAGWPLFREVLRHSFSLEHRRIAPPWMYYLVTALFSTAVAVVLSALFVGLSSRVMDPSRVWATFWQTWVISQCIGLCMQVVMDRFATWAHPRGLMAWPPFTRQFSIWALVLLAIMLGYVLGFALTGRNFLALVAQHPRFLLGQLIVAGLAVFTWFLISRAQSAQMRRETAQAKADAQAETLQRQTADAELRALQAQIEPHFLFNTLANAIALVDYEPAQAKRLLEQFNDYLRATLSASRRTHTTLGDELHLLERYLALMQIRMGARLAFEIDVPQDLRALPFAPLLLQPLVENAIEHGLEPKIEGGCIAVSARQDNPGPGARVVIAVRDTGLGSAALASSGNQRGVGLSNVRERVSALWGTTAQLSLQRDAHGCTASLEFDTA